MLYIACNGVVAALDTKTGEELWRTKLQGLLGATSGQDTTVISYRTGSYGLPAA